MQRRRSSLGAILWPMGVVAGLMILSPFAAGPAYYAAERGWLPDEAVELFRPVEFVLVRTPFRNRFLGSLIGWQDSGIGDRRAAERRSRP